MKQDAEYYNEKTKEAWNNGNYEEALEYNRKAVELNPKCERYHYNTGELMKKLNRMDEAKKAFQKGIDANPERADGYRLLGEVHAETKDYNTATELYHKALSLNPDDGNIIYDMGLVCIERKEYEAAVECFTRAIEKGYRNHYPYLFRAVVYNNNLHQYDKALEDINMAIKYEPNDFMMLGLKAAIYNNLQDTVNFNKTFDEMEENFGPDGRVVN